MPGKGTRMEAAQKSYEEMVDLFAQGTTPAKILAFRPSRAAQARVHALLARNKTGDLSLRKPRNWNALGSWSTSCNWSRPVPTGISSARGE